LDIFNDYSLDQLMIKTFGKMSGEHQFQHDDLKSHFQGQVGKLQFDLSCKYYNDKQFLQEIRFYFDLNLKPIDSTLHSDDCSKKDPIYLSFFN